MCSLNFLTMFQRIRDEDTEAGLYSLFETLAERLVALLALVKLQRLNQTLQRALVTRPRALHFPGLKVRVGGLLKILGRSVKEVWQGELLSYGFGAARMIDLGSKVGPGDLFCTPKVSSSAPSRGQERHTLPLYAAANFL